MTFSVSVALSAAVNIERMSNNEKRIAIALTSHVMIHNVIPALGALYNIVLFNLAKTRGNAIRGRKLRLSEVS